MAPGTDELGTDDCPKHMQYGPCGGVRPDGQCEMRSGPCAFPDVVAWDRAVTPSRPATTPLILSDFSCTPFDPDDLSATASLLADPAMRFWWGASEPPGLPADGDGRASPRSRGVPWITLSCRDRNRVVLEQELRGLSCWRCRQCSA